jgi:hypothetical protein
LRHADCIEQCPLSGAGSVLLEVNKKAWFNWLRGFGLLTCGEGTPDIFVLIEPCAASG